MKKEFDIMVLDILVADYGVERPLADYVVSRAEAQIENLNIDGFTPTEAAEEIYTSKYWEEYE